MTTNYRHDKKRFIRKAIASVLVLGCFVFVIMQSDVFRVEKVSEYPTMNVLDANDLTEPIDENSPRTYQSMIGNTTVSGTIQADSNHLKSVGFYFVNSSSGSASGTITLTIVDSHDRTLGKTEIDAMSIANRIPTIYYFGEEAGGEENWIVSSGVKGATEDLILTAGEKYQVTLTSKDVKSDGRLDLIMYEQEKETADLLMLTNFRFMNTKLLALCLAILLAALAFTWLPLERLRQDLNSRRQRNGKPEYSLNRLLLYIIFFLTPPVCAVISYLITDISFGQTMRVLILTHSGRLNFFLIIMLWLLFYTLTNRVKYCIILTTLTAGLFALTNYILIQFRDIPLIAADILSARTGFAVMGSYQLQLDRASVFTIIICVVWIAITLSLQGRKGLPWRSRVIPLIILMIGCGSFHHLIFQTDYLKKLNIYVSGFKPRMSYHTFGYPLSFVITFKDSFMDKPVHYSVETVKKTTDQYAADAAPKAEKLSKKTPNIIGIMNESFSDLSYLGDLKTSEDPMPFYHGLKENTVKGALHSSIYGSMTATTEFEFLTGFSGAFLPYRAIAYNNMVKENTPSATWNLKNNGYGGNIAFHPGLRNSYNRQNVYPRLGFEKQIALEDLDDPKLIRAFVSDEADYSIVENEYKQFRKTAGKQPFYIFNVTIQNHGGYLLSNGEVDAGINIRDSRINTEGALQFVNLMKESDLALEKLIDYFSNVEEPTVIVLFGDHQPHLEDEFYDAILGKTSEELTSKETENKYRVPFMIWANYDIPEEDRIEISANYLFPYMQRIIGGRLSAYDKYLLDLYEDVPVITTQGYYDKDGNLYDLDNKNAPFYDEVKEYEMIQYNGMVDQKHRVDDFFRLE